MTDETQAEPRAPARDGLAPGTQLGRYTLDRVLGAGGMGVVWAARDPDLERAVAIKVLRGADAGPMLRARLLREARAMARLKHANVLTVYEVGTDGDRDYIAMELVEGTNLDAWLAAGPPRTEVIAAILAAGRGLAAAHAAGLVHRDFKPHNVLRSRDGRVLVTDFGLARGTADDPRARSAPPAAAGTQAALADTLDAPATASPRPRDGLLESTLTQTGALIGTPAYMAPEQYEGAPPDPRTDQFAFCVTAWQALTGERPFRGHTVDELRRAVADGIAGVPARLPRRVRAVLARGLARDPDARWPDLDALLAALERALAPRRWRLVFPAFGIAAAAVLALSLHRGQPAVHAQAASDCEPADQAFTEAWTPARRAALVQRVGGPAAGIAAMLDELRETWLDRYAAACTAPRTPVRFARLGCLLGERDEVAAFARLADTLPAPAFARLDVRGILPRVEACAGDTPITPPTLPANPRARDRIIALRAEFSVLQLRDPSALLAQADAYRRRVRALAWPPLEPELDLALGAAARRIGRYTEAAARFSDAADRAEQLHDDQLEAWARISRLEVETVQTSEPANPAREGQLEREARDAVHRAGDDPDLAASIDLIVAGAQLARGDAGPAEAMLTKLWWGDAKPRSRIAGLQYALMIRLRLHQDDVEAARAFVLEDERTRPEAEPGHLEIERLAADLAWRAGDLDDAHARYDKLHEPEATADSRLIRGRVVDAHGAPVAGALVVAWQGQLAGDARRLYTSPELAGEIEHTDDQGIFGLLAPAHGAIAAEIEGARSTPIATPAPGKLITLVLRPVHAITVHVPGKPLPPLDAFVELSAGGARWRDRAILGPDGMARIAGIPDGDARVGVAGALDRDGRVVLAGRARDGATIAWPAGPTLDLIAGEPGHVIVLPGRAEPHLAGEHLELGDGTAVLAPLHPIGFASETDEGRKLYAPGDLHAIVRDNPPGDTTACLVTASGPRCTHLVVPAGAGTIAVRLR